MKKVFLLLCIFLIVPFNNLSISYAKSGCCSHHGGVAYCGSSGYYICNDGTRSPTCTCSYVPPPPPTQYFIVINRNGNGNGKVISSPSGINCGDDCSETYNKGTTITLTATADVYSTFTGWSGCDLVSGNTCTIAMNDNKTVYATFSQINYTLTLSKSGNGSVKVDGIVHSLPWSGQFQSGTNLQIEAISDSGWSFTNWSGDYTGSITPTTINMNGNKSIEANFSQNCDHILTINISPPGSGTVTKNPDKNNYCDNEQVSLTASPNENYNFSLWTGVDSSNGLTANVTMNENRIVEANFIEQAVNEPEINVSPVFIDFGDIMIGQSSALQDIISSNTGSGNLILGMLSIVGEGAGVIKTQNDNCTGKTLKQSESCTVNVVFTPLLKGSFHANLIIPSNDSDEPMVKVDLKGGSGADLTGEWLSLEQTCKNNKKGIKCKIKGKLYIQNIGSQNSSSSYVNFFLSDDNVYDEGDTFFKKKSAGKIKANKSKNMSFSYSFSYGVDTSSKYIIAVIDAEDKVVEADEDNNNIVYGPLP
ncbi:MAG: choice-of-anchor D domain-containing protein [Thermodesulfovibrionales bacterium]